MSFNATRLTCFALIAAIEGDCRESILNLQSGSAEATVTWPENAARRAHERLEREKGVRPDPSRSALVDYLDFADGHEILLANKSLLTDDHRKSLSAAAPHLGRIVAIRNRVAHTRPMEIDDLVELYDVARDLVRLSRESWKTIDETLQRLERNPEFVLGLTIQLPADPSSPISHNLPIPDFDETGFFGRAKELQRIKKALLGPYPVVSILGDGGLGKTSLALKAAYDLLDDSRTEFEAIVWVSAKATTLTSSEIRNIGGAIQDSLGLFEAAATELGAVASAGNDPMSEVLQYLESFRVLLILDNLETVTDQRLRDFLLELPNGSKVLITTRIGLGIENPVKLEPLSAAESRTLLRALASIRNVPTLKSLDEDGMAILVAAVKGHPLYIKWLVAGVQAGRRPSELVNDNSLLLEYCMSNVYDQLSGDCRQVLQSMQVMRGARGQGELAYLNEMSADQIQATLLELMTTNFVAMRQSKVHSLEASYETSDFASQYLARTNPVLQAFREHITARSTDLAKIGLRLTADGRAKKYDSHTVDVRGQHDVPAARLLIDAFKRADEGSVDAAIDLCREAQTLSPTYHEAWRVEATIQAKRQDRDAAISAFERAHEIAPDSAVASYHFGAYLAGGASEPAWGLRVLQASASAGGTGPQLLAEIAATHLLLGNYIECLDTYLSLAQSSQPGADKLAILHLALRGGSQGAVALRERGELSNSLQVIEAAFGIATEIDVQHIDAEATDWLLDLGYSTFAVATAAEGDEYLVKRANEYGSAIADRVRVVDSEAMTRVFGYVKNVEELKHFGFVRHAGADYFFHHNDLARRQDWPDMLPGVRVCFQI
ncbi:NB-ARC domain-containing protein [Cryobacterium tagatosivorans]|uniref:AAA family ATPase n=1 Tax=Cryobacterium tagatosivorans TaxID=1259199 RepID=A0A4R8UCQ6_9MICO|nr:NB-ARC domain-containing protein [Cryobacterium tagatosivorans]TFB46951.1 AAA family ATPase [Cryobacterium tagatosivorans]